MDITSTTSLLSYLSQAQLNMNSTIANLGQTSSNSDASSNLLALAQQASLNNQQMLIQGLGGVNPSTFSSPGIDLNMYNPLSSSQPIGSVADLQNFAQNAQAQSELSLFSQLNPQSGSALQGELSLGIYNDLGKLLFSSSLGSQLSFTA